MAKGHSVAPPSARNRTVQCPGHLVMEAYALLARPHLANSEDSRQGTGAHWVAEQLVMYGAVPAEGVPAGDSGVMTTEEMQQGAILMRDTLVSDLIELGSPTGLPGVAVEVAVDCPRIHPQVWGTPDYRAWIPARPPFAPRRTLAIWDYKFGHEVVEAYGCYQLTDYTSGSLSGMGWDGQEIIDVVLTIVQPRAHHRDGPVRRWKTNSKALSPFFEASALAVAEALDTETPPTLRVGPECKHCIARPTCPAMLRAAAGACDVAMQAQVHDLTPEQRGVELTFLERNLQLLEARYRALCEDVEQGIRQGQSTPGWKLDTGLAREVWSQPVEMVLAMADAWGVDVRKPAEAITPKQARARGFPEQVLKFYSRSTEGAARLVKDDGSKARQIFGS